METEDKKTPDTGQRFLRLGPKARKNMWKRAKAALFGLFTLLILFMLFGGEFGFLSAYRYTRYERILQEQLASEQARQDSLEKVLERLKNDPEYLERMAREKLSMVKDGEKIYRFEETEKEQ